MRSANPGDQKQTWSWSHLVDYLRTRSDFSSILFTALVTCSLSLLICSFFILPKIEEAILGMFQDEEQLAIENSARNMEKMIGLKLELLGMGGRDFASDLHASNGLLSDSEILASHFEGAGVRSKLLPAGSHPAKEVLTDYFDRLAIHDAEGNLLYQSESAQPTIDKKNSWLLKMSSAQSSQAVSVFNLGDKQELRMTRLIRLENGQNLFISGYFGLDGEFTIEGHHQIHLINNSKGDEQTASFSMNDSAISFIEPLEPFGLLMEIKVDMRSMSEKVQSLLWILMVLMGLGLTIIFCVFVLFSRELFRQTNKEAATTRQENVNISGKLATLMDAVIDAIVITNSKGVVEYFNQAAEEIFGYSWDEVLGNNVSMLVSENHAARHDTYIVEYLRSGKSDLVGGTREVSAKHKKGHVFPLELEVQAFKDNSDEEVTFVAIARDLTDQKVSQTELESYIKKLESQKDEFELAKDKAELSVENKKSFIATVSHEIRTPMNGVLGMTGLLANTSLDDEQKTYLEAIRESGNTLLFLINDLLDFSKLEANKLELDQRDFLPIKLIESAVTLVAVQAREKGVQMAAHIGPMVPQSLHGDPGRIRQIVVNYLSNAVKFTGKGGSVDVHLSCNEQRSDRVRVRLEVHDTGIGISEENIGLIFDEFSQADPSISRRFGGTGLGLAISKRIAELMGGSVGVESEQGKGSIFWAEFSLGVGSTILQPLTNVGPDLGLLKTMVIDSHPLNREVFVSQLRKYGIDSIEFGDLDDAMDEFKRSLVRQKPYNVILLDDELSRGSEVNDLITRNTNQPCFLVITSVLGRAITSEMRAKGVYLSVTKPVKESALIDIMSQISEDMKESMTIGGSESEFGDDSSEKTLPELDAQKLSLNVLIAEDSEVSQQFAVGLLSSWGCNVEVVGNGLEALEAITEKDFDLVLMDMIMPEMNGIEACRKIRQLEGNRKNVPIIGITGNILDEDQLLFLAAGANDVIIKPIDRAELWRSIQKQTFPDKAVDSSRIEPKAIGKKVLSETVSLDVDGKSKIKY